MLSDRGYHLNKIAMHMHNFVEKIYEKMRIFSKNLRIKGAGPRRVKIGPIKWAKWN
jgi:hypothetical protein